MQQVKMNKRYSEVYNSYLKSWYRNLWDIYNHFSQAKQEAYNYCLELCDKYNGYDLKIIGGNTSTFSVGFKCLVDGVENFVYITRDYDKIMKIEG